MTDHVEAEVALKSAEKKFRYIDVLLNNTGIGHFAAVEESKEYQVSLMFNINVFGLSRLIHVALSNLRKRRKKLIVNFTSIGRLTSSIPLIGLLYCYQICCGKVVRNTLATGRTLGIKVNLVEPSVFPTDWAGCSANESRHRIDDYAKKPNDYAAS